MLKAVGLAGKKGSGKDTAAEALAVKGYYVTSFAKALKEEVAEAFGMSPDMLNDRNIKETPLTHLSLNACKDGEFYNLALAWCKESDRLRYRGGYMRNPITNSYNLSPRVAMQLWGTEYKRQEDNLYWIKRVEEELKGVKPDKVCISDVREPHEVEFVKAIAPETLVILIDRENNQYANCGTSDHSSESKIDTLKVDCVVSNHGTIEEFKNLILEVVGEKE